MPRSRSPTSSPTLTMPRSRSMPRSHTTRPSASTLASCRFNQRCSGAESGLGAGVGVKQIFSGAGLDSELSLTSRLEQELEAE